MEIHLRSYGHWTTSFPIRSQKCACHLTQLLYQSKVGKLLKLFHMVWAVVDDNSKILSLLNSFFYFGQTLSVRIVPTNQIFWIEVCAWWYGRYTIQFLKLTPNREIEKQRSRPILPSHSKRIHQFGFLEFIIH